MSIFNSFTPPLATTLWIKNYFQIRFFFFFWNYINFLSTYIPIFIPVVKFLRQSVLLAWFAKPEKYAYFIKNSISRKFSFFSVCDIYLFICYHLWIWSSCRLTNLKRILKCFISFVTK